jgi:hypothetical protein
MMASQGNWLLSNPTAWQSGASAKKMVREYFEFALASKIAKRLEARHLTDDVERIDYALRRVQLRVLNYREVQFDPRDWPALLSGIGYCDQTNAAACKVLAHSFKHAQLYALTDVEHHTSPHTIGRVWSTNRNEWLYFDASGDRPIVFRRRSDGGVEILNHPFVTYRSREAPPAWTYRMNGQVMNEYTSTYSSYMEKRILDNLRQSAARRSDATPSVSPPSAAPSASPSAAPSASPSASPSAPPSASAPRAPVRHPSQRDADIARQYVAARAEDILGDRKKALAHYAALAALPVNGLDDESRLLIAAAQQFATRPEATAPNL